MNIQKIKITELKPAEYNPRKDLKPEDIEYQKIKRSITEFGYVAPIIINNDMTVISGHQRLKVLEFDKPIKNEEHPTMKPIDLLAYLIKNSSKENELILDLFGGSGSTLIAAEQTNRKCYMMELDPKYCDVIIRRWEKLTGQKAELEKK